MLSKKNIQRIKQRLESKGIDIDNTTEGVEGFSVVGLHKNDIVPVRGSVHVSQGLVISRKEADKLLRK